MWSVPGSEYACALDREMKRKYDLPHGGVIIAQIFRGSPAAGILRPGDIVIKANGKEITSPSDLQGCIFGARVGSVIEMEVLRSGSVRKVKVTVEKSPSALFSGNFRRRNVLSGIDSENSVPGNGPLTGLFSCPRKK